LRLDLRANRLVVVEPPADRHGIADPLRHERTDRADRHRFVGHRRVRIRQVRLRVHRDLLLRAATDEPEHVFPVEVARRPNAPRTQNAAVVVNVNVRMRSVHVALGPEVWIPHRGDAEPVRQRLQLAVAALLAEHAEMVPLDEQHLDDASPELQQFGRVILDDDPFGDRLAARRLRPAVHKHRAHATRPVRHEILLVTEPGNIDPRLVGGLDDRLARLAPHLDAVNRERDHLAHAPYATALETKSSGRLQAASDPTPILLTCRRPTWAWTSPPRNRTIPTGCARKKAGCRHLLRQRRNSNLEQCTGSSANVPFS